MASRILLPLALLLLLLACSTLLDAQITEQDYHPQVDTGSCRWVQGWYGDFISCASDEVVYGSCASGKNPDCDGGAAYDMIYCCKLVTYDTQTTVRRM